MHRRCVVCAGALIAVARPVLARSRDFTVGVLVTPATMALPEGDGKFRSALARRGLVEGDNLALVFQMADERGLFASAAQKLVAADVDVIVAMGGTPSARAAKDATATIPIVMMSASDPVGDGLVASLARPGGNVTGNCTFGTELVVKRLQLLTQVLSRPKSIAYLRGSTLVSARYEAYEQALAQEAAKAGLRMEIVRLRTLADLEAAFDEMHQRGVDGVVLDNPARFLGQETRIASLALANRLPAIGDFRTFPAAGLLMSYGPDYEYVVDRTADYVARIWKGAKPGDLPIELVAKFDLCVNAATARALGITLPRSVTVMVSRVYR